MKLLLAGGSEDPNIQALADAARRLHVPIIDLRIQRDESPAFTWELESGELKVDGQEVDAQGAFVRFDVFAALRDSRPQVTSRAAAWFHAVAGWIDANAAIRTLNRHMTSTASNKPATLLAARTVGVPIPQTLVSNELDILDPDGDERIAKPVAGGDYCYPLGEALGRSRG